MGSTPLFRWYLRWIRTQTHADLRRARLSPPLGHVLLCGTSGEHTSIALCQHVLQRAPDARITILDQGQEQLDQSAAAILGRFPDADVQFLRADARHTGLPDDSVDWIDTDFLFVYLDHPGLDALLAEWRRILSPQGAVSFRALASRSWPSRTGSALMNRWLQVGFRSQGHSHSLDDITTLLRHNGYTYTIAGHAFLPFGYRIVATQAAR